MRHGTVEQGDANKQRLRVRLGEGDEGPPFTGPWVPYAQIAATLRELFRGLKPMRASASRVSGPGCCCW